MRDRLGAAASTSSRADATEPRAVGAGYDRVLVDPPCSDLGTLASRPDARWRKSPEQIERAGGVAGADPATARGRGAARPGGGSSTRPARSRARENEAGSPRCSARAVRRSRGRSGAPRSRLAAPAIARFLQTAPDRDRTDGFFIAALDREGESPPRALRARMSSGGRTERPRPLAAGLPGLRRAVAAPDAAPGPLPLRLLPAALRAGLAVPDCGEHQTIVRMSDTEDMRCQHCGDSMLQADLAWPVRELRELIGRPAGRALDPLGRLRAARRAGRRGAGRRRAGDPRRRHGRRTSSRRSRSGPLIVDAIADQVHEAGGVARLPPDDRAPGAPDRRVRRGRRRLDHDPRRGDAARSTALVDAIREAGCLAGLAINPGTPVDALARVAADCDLLLCMTVNPGWGGQAFIEARRRRCGRLAALGSRRRRSRSTAASTPRPAPTSPRPGRDLLRRRLRDLRRRPIRPPPTARSPTPPAPPEPSVRRSPQAGRVDRRRSPPAARPAPVARRSSRARPLARTSAPGSARPPTAIRSGPVTAKRPSARTTIAAGTSRRVRRISATSTPVDQRRGARVAVARDGSGAPRRPAGEPRRPTRRRRRLRRSGPRARCRCSCSISSRRSRRTSDVELVAACDDRSSRAAAPPRRRGRSR